MSLSADGRQIICDGAECFARAAVPVALRPLLGPDRTAAQSNGWLFAARRGEWRHYCPNCLSLHLEHLPETPAPTS
ncbi:MAG: hypothetical protein ACRYFS_05730 [Janthinobacterium lividum]